MVWGLVRRRVTRRLAGLRTMGDVLGYRRIWWNDDEFQFTQTGTEVFCDNLEPCAWFGSGETPSNSASHRAQNYGWRSWVSQNMVKWRWISIYLNQNGSTPVIIDVNLIMHSTGSCVCTVWQTSPQQLKNKIRIKSSQVKSSNVWQTSCESGRPLVWV